MLGGGPQAMSVCIVEGRQQRPGPPTAACGGNGGRARWARGLAAAAPEARYRGPGSAATRRERSEEHTSELQSLAYLVCRLLLEKKKKNTRKTSTAKATAFRSVSLK